MLLKNIKRKEKEISGYPTNNKQQLNFEDDEV
jgi:hypothetical protein